MTVATPLLSVMDGISSAEAIGRLVQLLYPDASTALDMTFGSGKFWGPETTLTSLTVTAMDLDPYRAQDVCGDFTALPFADGAFDLAVFDPPYQTDMGRAKPSVMGDRFGTFATMRDLEAAVRAGCREAQRVGRLGAIVKAQDYIHASEAVWMSEWVRGELGPPYDFLIVRKPRKMLDPKWTEQLSVWRNHSTYWCFRFDGQRHKRRVRSEAQQ